MDEREFDILGRPVLNELESRILTFFRLARAIKETDDDISVEAAKLLHHMQNRGYDTSSLWINWLYFNNKPGCSEAELKELKEDLGIAPIVY